MGCCCGESTTHNDKNEMNMRQMTPHKIGKTNFFRSGIDSDFGFDNEQLSINYVDDLFGKVNNRISNAN